MSFLSNLRFLVPILMGVALRWHAAFASTKPVGLIPKGIFGSHEKYQAKTVLYILKRVNDELDVYFI